MVNALPGAMRLLSPIICFNNVADASSTAILLDSLGTGASSTGPKGSGGGCSGAGSASSLAASSSPGGGAALSVLA